MLGEGAAVELGAEGSLTLAASQQLVAYEGEDGWATRTVAYMYVIAAGGSELLAFHWHPAGPSAVRTPHLHIGADVQAGALWLPKAHVPTGAVALGAVLDLLLGELGVRALCDDWQAATAGAP